MKKAELLDLINQEIKKNVIPIIKTLIHDEVERVVNHKKELHSDKTGVRKVDEAPKKKKIIFNENSMIGKLLNDTIQSDTIKAEAEENEDMPYFDKKYWSKKPAGKEIISGNKTTNTENIVHTEKEIREKKDIRNMYKTLVESTPNNDTDQYIDDEHQDMPDVHSVLDASENLPGNLGKFLKKDYSEIVKQFKK